MAKELKTTLLGNVNLTGTKVTPGRSVALNLNRCSYLRLGSLCLTFANPVSIIPFTITEGEQRILQEALDLGKIVMSDRPVENSEAQDNKFERVEEMFDEADTPEQLEDLIMRIATGHIFVHKLIGPSKILDHLIQYEGMTLSRPEVVEMIERAMDTSPGVSDVVKEGEDELVKLRVQEGVVHVVDGAKGSENQAASSGPDMSEFV